MDAYLNKVISWLKVGENPEMLTQDSTGRWLYIPDEGGHRVVVHDRLKNQNQTLWVGNSPRKVVVDEKRNLLYVVNYTDQTLSIANRKTLRILRNLPVGGRPVDVVASHYGKYLVLFTDVPKQMVILDTKKWNILHQVALPDLPSSFQLSLDEQGLYLNFNFPHQPLHYDVAKNYLTTLDLHWPPLAKEMKVRKSLIGPKQYVYWGKNLFEVDESTNLTTNRIHLGKIPQKMLLSKDRQRIYLNYQKPEQWQIVPALALHEKAKIIFPEIPKKIQMSQPFGFMP